MTDQVKTEIKNLDLKLESTLKADNPELFLLYREGLYQQDTEPDQPVEPEASVQELESIETDT